MSAASPSIAGLLADNEPLEKIMKYSHLPKEKVIELQMPMTAQTAK
ncbi:hypothetical protein [Fibrobacter sp.]